MKPKQGMNPIVETWSTLSKHRVDRRYRARAALFFLRAVMGEPFRWLERAGAAVRGDRLTLPHPPLFLLGYYRSGTTHLQQTLLEDPRWGFLNFYQCYFPEAFLVTERWLKPVLERIVKLSGRKHPVHRVPYSLELPAEEDVAMLTSGFRLACGWGHTFPRDFKAIWSKMALMEGLEPSELESWKDALHTLLCRVSKANGHKPLLLKSPPQLGRLSILRDMYPEAKFLFIHRNPYDVFASNKKLWKAFEKIRLQDVDASTVREHILWSYERGHHAYERDKPLLRPNQLCEVSFDEFRAAPLTTLRRIYETLELGDFDGVEPRFAAHLDARHQSQQPAYGLSEIERAEIAERLSSWLEARGYATTGHESAST